MQSPLTIYELPPDEVFSLSKAELVKKIEEKRRQLGEKLVILAHHYQRQEIVDLSDYQGDSLRLAQLSGSLPRAKYIVFCGVDFMAESAAILSLPGQAVLHPDHASTCPMANMVPIPRLEEAWEKITAVSGAESFIPICYVNTTARVKAFCGAHGGVACTSGNASRVVQRALKEDKAIFFLPDQHLGYNTARKLGIADENIMVWNRDGVDKEPIAERVKRARMILWDGYCHVHTLFRPRHVEAIRRRYPDARIIVHPECTHEVVALVDATGSTEQIIEYVEASPKGSTIAIGTEINMVLRLARQHRDKKIIPLIRSLCPNMYRINVYNLYWTLENLGKVNVVEVPEEVKRPARLALSGMLKG